MIQGLVNASLIPRTPDRGGQTGHVHVGPGPGGGRGVPGASKEGGRPTRLEDLKEVKGWRPFEPFEIHLADGRAIPIGHPDALAWPGPDFAPVLHIMHADGRWQVVNFSAITSLAPPVPAAEDDGD